MLLEPRVLDGIGLAIVEDAIASGTDEDGNFDVETEVLFEVEAGTLLLNWTVVDGWLSLIVAVLCTPV